MRSHPCADGPRRDAGDDAARSHITRDDRVGADLRLGVDDDAVGVRKQQPPADPRVERGVRANDRFPHRSRSALPPASATGLVR